MKLKKVLLVVLFSLFFNTSFVFAANDIIYDVDSLSVSNNQMTVKGYSFIDHADNYGGKNLTTYLIAFVGNWTNVMGSDGNLNFSDIQKCKGINGTNDKCMAFKASTSKIDNKIVDMYTLRCIKEACYKTYQDSHRTRLASGTEDYEDSRCTKSNKNNGKEYPDSHCLYYNVGFTRTINLVDVYKHFSQFTNTTIYFRVASVVKVKRTSGTYEGKQVYIARSSPLGVSKSAVKNTTTYNKTTGYYSIPTNFQITVGNKVRKYKSISFKGISDQYYQTAGSAKPRTDYKMTKAAPYYIQQYKYFTINESYNSNGFYKGRTKENATYKKYAVNVDYNRSIYTKIYAVKGKQDDTVDRIVPGTTKTYFVPAGWGRVSGQFVLTNSTTVYDDEPDPEPSCICLGGNCNGESSCVTNEQTSSSCNVTSSSKTGCSAQEFDGNCTETISSSDNYYYYRIKAATINEDLKKANDTTIDLVSKGATLSVYANGKYGVRSVTENNVKYYYIPIVFHSNVVYTQNAKLTLNNFVNEQEINSGRFFEFSVGYDVSANWKYATYSINRNSSNNWYTFKKKIRYQSVLSGVTTYKDVWVYFHLSTSDGIYIFDDSTSSFKKIANYGIQSNGVYYDFIDENSLDDKMKDSSNLYLDVEFPDSNKPISSNVVNNPGIFSCELKSEDTTNHKFEHFCTYTIPQAYLDPSDGSVYYSNLNDAEVEEAGGNDTTSEDTTSDDSVSDDTISDDSVSDDSVSDDEIVDDSTEEEGDIVTDDQDAGVSGVNQEYEKMHNEGSFYYIPYSMQDGEIFEFTINSSQLSLFDEIGWSYNGTCQVRANKVKLQYRTIDTSNPFPKADATYSNIASNWKEYYGIYNSFSRITDNSYTNISYRTNLINDKSIFATFNERYGSYGSFADMDNDTIGSGNSSVISSSLFEIAIGNHCGSAEFAVDCDKTQ